MGIVKSPFIIVPPVRSPPVRSSDLTDKTNQKDDSHYADRLFLLLFYKGKVRQESSRISIVAG